MRDALGLFHILSGPRWSPGVALGRRQERKPSLYPPSAILGPAVLLSPVAQRAREGRAWHTGFPRPACGVIGREAYPCQHGPGTKGKSYVLRAKDDDFFFFFQVAFPNFRLRHLAEVLARKTS